MALKKLLLDEAEKVYSITERLFTLVPNNNLQWKPSTGKNWMTVAQLLMHCASFGCGKAVKGFVTGDWGLPEGTAMEDLDTENQATPGTVLPAVKSVEEAIELLKEDRKLTISCISEVDETELLNRLIIAPWGGRELTLFQHLYEMIAHLAHHKGQLFYYLKLMGKDVSSKELWEYNG